MNLSFKDGKLRKATIHDVVEYNVNDCRHHGHPSFVSITAIDDEGAEVSAFYPPEIAQRLSDRLAALFAEPAQSGDPLEQAIDKAIGTPELLARAATTPVDAVTAMMDGDRAKEEADAPY